MLVWIKRVKTLCVKTMKTNYTGLDIHETT